MKRFIIIITALFVGSMLFASFDDLDVSPRARSMGGAFYSHSDDAYAIFYNPAGLRLAQNNLKASYSRLFNNDFQVLNTIGMSMELPRKWGTVGIGLQSFDVEYMNVSLTSEKTYSLSHAFTILEDIHTSLFFGYSANLYHLSFEGMGNQTAMGMNLGALAILHGRTYAGFTVKNINNPTMGEENSHELPQMLACGIAYIPYPGVTTALELRKPFADETQYHAGVEAQVVEMMTVRIGARNRPASITMGASFSLYNATVDYGFSSHAVLGGTHHIGLGYGF